MLRLGTVLRIYGQREALALVKGYSNFKRWSVYVGGSGGDSAAEGEGPVPHPGSHSARGLLQALVSSKNRSSDSARFGFSSSCGKVRGRPLTVRCLRRAAVNSGHWKSTCSMVCRGSPHWQAICSCVCCGKNRCVYSPMNACPVTNL